MARPKKTASDFKIKELNLQEAQRVFNRKRGRGSKYDKVLDAVEKLEQGKALLVEQISYAEVTGVRNRMRDYLGENWKIEATKVDKEKNLYDVMIHREK